MKRILNPTNTFSVSQRVDSDSSVGRQFVLCLLDTASHTFVRELIK